MDESQSSFLYSEAATLSAISVYLVMKIVTQDFSRQNEQKSP